MNSRMAPQFLPGLLRAQLEPMAGPQRLSHGLLVSLQAGAEPQSVVLMPTAIKAKENNRGST